MSGKRSDVKKLGYLLKIKSNKLKKNKKKYFVLRESSPAGGPARLEYYESEDKFKQNTLPSCSIILSTCFCINTKCHAKHRYTLDLFTKGKCFTIGCDNEEEQQAWLKAMLELRNAGAEDENAAVPLFDRIWPVIVKAKGVGNGPHVIPGEYRLCLTNTSLGLVGLNHEEPGITFQLDSIRRCGNKDKFFFMELGRGCPTGEGELWLQVEDDIIANNMHEHILSSMVAIKNMKQTQHQPQPHRLRSRSNADNSIKPGSRKSTHGGDSSTLPKRSKTLSASDHHITSSSIFRRGSAHSPNKAELDAPRTRSSMLSGSPKAMNLAVNEAIEGHRLRTDSMESRASSRGTASSLSADEMDTTATDRNIIHSLTPEGDSYLDMAPSSSRSSTLSRGLSIPTPNQPEGGAYLDMAPVAGETKIIVPTTKDYSKTDFIASTPTPQRDDYLDMATTPTQGSGSLKEFAYIGRQLKGDAYAEMGPCNTDAGPSASSPYLDMAMNSVASSSLSSISSAHDSEDHNAFANAYMDMSPGQSSFLFPLRERQSVDGGYIEMNSPPAMNSASILRGSPSLRPDPVVSYLRREDSSKDDFPKRAYSVGSRASVMDSKPLKDAYLDMSIDSSDKKSSSTPHLTDRDAHHRHRGSQDSVHQETRRQRGSQDSMQAHKSNRDLPDLFMELDFNHPDDLRPRTSSTGSSKDFRSRTSSGGSKDFRSRTSSFGLEEGHHKSGSKLQRLASFLRASTEKNADGHRPRTTTICQDSLRPRTSSFGPSDMRPRSSSQGNARLKDRLRKMEKPTSQESLKRSSKVTSTESVCSNTSDYLDMQPKSGSSPSMGFMSGKNESEYMAMERLPERLAASPLVRESIDEGYMAMDLSTNQVTHSARSKGAKRSSGSKGSSSSESLSSSSQSSMDAKPKLMGQEYTEMDFSSSRDAYVSYAPVSAKDSKVSKGMDKVTSPIRTDLPQMGETGSPSAAHVWLQGKQRKKGPDYINLDYSGEKDVREPLIEGESSPVPVSVPVHPNPPTRTVLFPAGPQPAIPEKSRTMSGSSDCGPSSHSKPAPPKLKVPVPPCKALPAPADPPARPSDPFQLNVKVSNKASEPEKVTLVPGALKDMEAAIRSRGSSSSLSSIDPAHSSLCAGPMPELSKSSQLLFPNDASGPLMGPTSSKTSLISNEGEVAYAKLDLASSREDTSCLCGSNGAASIKSRHSSAEEEVPLQYAEIDFEGPDDRSKKDEVK